MKVKAQLTTDDRNYFALVNEATWQILFLKTDLSFLLKF